jgi:hypothetical protein
MTRPCFLLQWGILSISLLLFLLCTPRYAQSYEYGSPQHGSPEPASSSQRHGHERELGGLQQHLQRRGQEAEEEEEEGEEELVWADDFQENVPPSREDIPDFSPTLPSSSDVVLSHFKRAVRYLVGE